MPDSMPADADESLMRRALDLAAHGEGWVEPNPMVGCVLARDGRVLGEGYHRKFGGPHAEVEAIRSLASSADAAGSTAYVTLEPCCHHGKTPPCTRALIDAGVARVVIAMEDPFPKVDGGGIAQLTNAGIETRVGLLQSDSEGLNAPYLKRVTTGVPWVIAKWAMTIDGRIATVDRDSQWITSPLSREHVHRLRGRVDAVTVGMGTVNDDDPLLTARLADGPPPRIAQRVVFCRHRLPSLQSQLIQSLPQAPLTLMVGNAVPEPETEQLRALDVQIVETGTDDPRAMVDAALRWMGDQSMTNVMLEGGSKLLASFFERDQIDECHVYTGPIAVGGDTSPGPIGGAGVSKIADARRFALKSVEALQNDLKVVYRRLNRD